MSRARLLAYAPLQLRDFLLRRGVPMLLVGLLIGVQLALISRLRGGLPASISSLSLVMQAVRAVAVPFVIIALGGIVSADRRHGYFRFLFAKPLSPTRFYLQLLVVHGAGLLIVVGVLLALFQLFIHPVNPLPALAEVLALYVLMAGMALFISAHVRADWVVLAIVWFAAEIVQGNWRNSTDWRIAVVRLLPPVQSFDEIANALANNSALAAEHVLWLVGYSAVFLLLGVLSLERRTFTD